MTYRQMKIEGRRLAREIDKAGSAQWRFAELCYLACEEPPEGQAKVTAKEWGAEMGRSADNINHWRRVWRRFGADPARPDFLDAWVLAGVGAEQGAAIRVVAETKGKSLNAVNNLHRAEVREIRDRLASDPAITAEVLADPDLVRQALANPLVADAVAGDAASYSNVAKARSDQIQRKARILNPTGGRPLLNSPRPRRTPEMSTVAAVATHRARIERELRAMLQTLMDSAELDPDWRETLAGDLGRIDTLLAGIRSWLASGGATDSALAALLEEGAS